MNQFEKRCEECAEMQTKGGCMTCAECFGQKCAEIDDCPLGISCEEVEKAESVKVKTVMVSEDKPKRKAPVRKEDADKRELIEFIRKGLVLACNSADIEITNVEREINFTFNDRKFKVVLSCPRK